MRIGMGTVLEQSGDDLTRESIGFGTVSNGFMAIRTVSGGNRETKAQLGYKAYELDYKDDLKNLTTPQGKQLLNGKHLQRKLIFESC
jgi:hypothetical protein